MKAGSDDFLVTVSGTNGIAGAADAVLLLERGRNNADGVLHITGRDVEETDYALSYDPADGAWNLLDGLSPLTTSLAVSRRTTRSPHQRRQTRRTCTGRYWAFDVG